MPKRKWERAPSEPISPLGLGIFSRQPGDEEHPELLCVRAAIDEKLDLLFVEFGLPARAWEALARALAEEFVAGLQVGKGAGSPKKWGLLRQVDLIRDIESRKAKNPRLSTLAAARAVALTEPWKTELSGHDNAKL